MIILRFYFTCTKSYYYRNVTQWAELNPILILNLQYLYFDFADDEDYHTPYCEKSLDNITDGIY